MHSDFLIGTWIQIYPLSEEAMTIDFVDAENVIISVQSEIEKAKYKLANQDSIADLMISRTSEVQSKFIVIPKSHDIIILYLPQDYEMEFQSNQQKPGKIAWGWTKPAPMEFKRL